MSKVTEHQIVCGYCGAKLGKIRQDGNHDIERVTTECPHCKKRVEIVFGEE